MDCEDKESFAHPGEPTGEYLPVTTLFLKTTNSFDIVV